MDESERAGFDDSEDGGACELRGAVGGRRLLGGLVTHEIAMRLAVVDLV